MTLINPNQDASLVQWTVLISLLAGTACACLLVMSTARRKTSLPQAEPSLGPPPPPERGVRLQEVDLNRAKADTDIDIVAIHGLDTTSPDTWAWRDPRDPTKQVNWLDPGMLPETIDRARIFTCDWPADLLSSADLIPKTIEEYAVLLLDGIQRTLFEDDARRQDRPIVFIASCLGGIVLTKAIVHADSARGSYHHIRTRVRGIIFLATPFRGTSFQDVAAWAEPGLNAWAMIQGRRVSQLLDTANASTFDIEELVRKFTQLCQDKNHPCEVFNFYEVQMTSLPLKVFPWLPAWFRQEKQLVNRSSATLDMVPNPLPLNRRHSLMNKFHGPECADYKKVIGKIEEIVRTIRAGTPLQQADTWLHNEHYKDKLRIERLSGELLSMEQCYINLAILEQTGPDAGRLKKGDTKSSFFSFFARQRVETPDASLQINLPALFNPRKGRDSSMIQPRRIIIRGRAGVGKTTLCKKMVYDFIHHSVWKDKFDRLLWVPLRRLKHWQEGMPNLSKLFHHEYFGQHRDEDGLRLANALHDAALQRDERTLLILDGLDEVSGAWNRDDQMYRFLETLLNQPNVIITSRPSGSLPASLVRIDLELETIGFYPDQVQAYLNADPKIKPIANKVQSFLQQHWVIQGLVRIPIQLDAFCYTWEDFGSKTMPETMTGVYKAIEQKLWRKDIERLGKDKEPAAVEDGDVQRLVQDEIYFLEMLAFTGLCENIIDFTPEHRKTVSEHLRRQHQGWNLSLHKILPHLSFLRTSDQSSSIRVQNYHFLHLTFQEYFAARYFARQWMARKPLDRLSLKGQKTEATSPVILVQKQKYSARYDVFWRFVGGLLDLEKGILQFFKAIEQEPLDLLGPAHQRLVMHCLSEVSGDLPIRGDLQKRLSKWLLFECRFCGIPQLAGEAEFPEKAVNIALCEGSDVVPMILESLARRATLSEEMLAGIAAQLDDADRKVRWAAIEALGRQPSLSEEMLASVVARLDDADKGVRQVAVEALGSQPSLSEEMLANVAARLDDADKGVRQAAVEALSSQLSLSEEMLAGITARLDDADEDVRQAAIEALSSQPSLSEEILAGIIARLDNADNNVRMTAVKALGWQPSLSEEMLAGIRARLDDAEWRVRQAAVEALGSQPSLSDEMLAGIRARLNDADYSVLQAAIEALGRQSSLSEEMLAGIAARLDNDADWSVRWAAIEALGRQPSLSDEMLASVMARLDDADKSVRQAAVKALGRQPSLLEEMLAGIAARLDDADWSVRQAAVEALSRQPSLSEEMLAGIAARLDNADWNVRQAAIEALSRQPSLSEEMLAGIRARLDNADEGVRRAAIKALGWQPSLSEEMLADIAARLDDADEGVRQAAVEALGRQPSLSDVMLADVAARLDDAEWSVRRAAIEALSSQPSLSEEMLAGIAARLDDADKDVRWAAMKALGSQPSLSEEILIGIAAQLDDAEAYIRRAAIEALSSQPSLSEVMLAGIAARLDDADKDVRWAADETLRLHAKFYCNLLNSPSAKSLYQIALEKSFRKQHSWYIDDDQFCVNVPEQITNTPFAGQKVVVGTILSGARPPDMPSVVEVDSELSY